VGTTPQSSAISIGYTFDDVLLLPGESSVLPKDVDTSVKLTDTINE